MVILFDSEAWSTWCSIPLVGEEGRPSKIFGANQGLDAVSLSRNGLSCLQICLKFDAFFNIFRPFLRTLIIEGDVHGHKNQDFFFPNWYGIWDIST